MFKKVICLLIIITLVGVTSCKVMPTKDSKQKQPQEKEKITQVTENLGRLEKKFSLDKNIFGLEQHLYQTQLNKGECTEVIVSGLETNITISLLGKNAEEILKINDSNSFHGTERIPIFAEIDGNYTIIIKSAYSTPANGKYTLNIAQAAPASHEQTKDYKAEQLFYQAGKERKIGTEIATKKAIELYEQTLSIYKDLQNIRKQALTYLHMGRAFSALGDQQNAVINFERALKIADKEIKAQALNLSGLAYYSIGNTEKSLELLTEALLVIRDVEDRENEADTLSTIGSVYWLKLDPEKARDYYYQALSIWKPLGLNQDLIMHNLATVCDDLGEYDIAEKYYREALRLVKEKKDKEGELIGTIMFARNRALTGDFEGSKALYDDSLKLAELVGNITIKGILLAELGNMNIRLGKTNEAKIFYEQTLILVEKSSDKKAESIAQVGLGKIYSSLGETSKALQYLEKGLRSTQQTGEQLIEMDALYGIALIYAKQGKALKSLEVTKNILGILESIRSKLYTFRSKTAYFASVRDYYGLYINNLFRLKVNNVTEETFLASEKAHARAFTENLAEVNAKIDSQIDPSLTKQHREQLSLLSVKLQTRLEFSKETTGTKQNLERIDKEIDQITENLQEIEKKIAKTNLQYGALKYFPIISLKDVQSKLLDKETVLIEYFLGNENSYVWVIGTDFANSYKLPKETEIEQLAIDTQHLISERIKGEKFENNNDKINRTELADEELRKKLKLLSDIILKPITEKIKNKRLLIIADGALNYIPFAALSDPMDNLKWLVINHEIVNIASVAVLSVLENQKNIKLSPEKTVTIFADPIFSDKDLRFKKKDISEADEAEQITINRDNITNIHRDAQSFLDRDSDGRLIYSRREAEFLLKILPSNQVKAYLDSFASLNELKSPKLPTSRILHLATHGLFSVEHPELSGLMFSRFNEHGKTQNAFISASEIYSLKLPVELVVLSACQTGLGKNIKGEGIVGLTRGFMYAGAKKVMVSLWSVNDRATSELMTNFYQKLLLEQKPPAQALREAQINLIESTEWKNPYYWAAFTLHGNYR